MSALLKLHRSLRDEGLLSTARKIFHYTIDIFRRLNQRKQFRAMDRMFKSSPPRSEVFNFIYKKNIWSMRETKSGAGSTLRYTENARKHIQSILTDYSIKSIYDAPCGDFNWMRLVVAGNPQVEYLGADIVPDLIDYNRAKFQTERIKFTVSDIVVDPFPMADLWICRDCLAHFSNKDVLSALEKFYESKTKFMLTTSHPTNHQKNQNADIYTGQFRPLNLFSDPFNFPTSVKYRFPDYVEPHPPREMILLSRDDILIALPRMRDRIAVVSKRAPV